MSFGSTTVSTVEAAERLGVSRTRIAQLIEAGRLPAHRDGPAWRISSADLDNFAHSYRRISPGRRRKPDLPASAVRILALLSAWDDPDDPRPSDGTDPSELAHAIDLNIGNVRKHLRALEDRGLVVQGPFSTWRATPAGRSRITVLAEAGWSCRTERPPRLAHQEGVAL
jgi:excisionase family DNA binding protein